MLQVQSRRETAYCPQLPRGVRAQVQVGQGNLPAGRMRHRDGSALLLSEGIKLPFSQQHLMLFLTPFVQPGEVRAAPQGLCRTDDVRGLRVLHQEDD